MANIHKNGTDPTQSEPVPLLIFRFFLRLLKHQNATEEVNPMAATKTAGTPDNALLVILFILSFLFLPLVCMCYAKKIEQIISTRSFYI